MDSTLDQRCLPLGYAFFCKEPDPELACDDPACEVVADEHDIIRLNCGHFFHISDEEHSYALPREVLGIVYHPGAALPTVPPSCGSHDKNMCSPLRVVVVVHFNARFAC